MISKIVRILISSQNIRCTLSSFLIQQDVSRLRPISPMNKSKSHDNPLKRESTNSPPSCSPSQQTSLRVFRNINSKQQQQPNEQLLRNNNSIQRSETSRCSPSPSPPGSSSPTHVEDSDQRMNNSPLDFTSKKVDSKINYYKFYFNPSHSYTGIIK